MVRSRLTSWMLLKPRCLIIGSLLAGVRLNIVETVYAIAFDQEGGGGKSNDLHSHAPVFSCRTVGASGRRVCR